MQVSRFAAKYVRHIVETRGYSPRSAESYHDDYLQFVAYLQSRGDRDDMRDFTGDTVAGFVAFLQSHGIGASTIGKKLSALSSLAKYALTQKDDRGRYFLNENPVQRVERPRRIRPTRKFLRRDELTAFRTVEAEPHEAIARDLFIDTWLRVSELATANVEDLWIDQKNRVILSVIVKGRGRQEEKVHIPLEPALAERLTALLRQREAGPKDPLLVNSQGNRYSRQCLGEAMKRLGHRAGIERLQVRPHAIRHTCNVLGRQAGLDPVQRAKLLNHTDANSVTRYDHLLPDETIEARDRYRSSL